MSSKIDWLIAAAELTCDGCDQVIKHAERYGYVCEEGKPSLRLCEKCCKEKGYLKIYGLIAILEWTCDGCGKVIRHPHRYGYLVGDEEIPGDRGKPLGRFCEECSRKKGYLKRKDDGKGHYEETFL